MDKKIITELKELRGHLQRVEILSDQDRQIVERLQNDIQSLLQHPEKGPAPDFHALGGQLEGARDRFEVSHPDLTAIMARVVNTLSTMGI